MLFFKGIEFDSTNSSAVDHSSLRSHRSASILAPNAENHFQFHVLRSPSSLSSSLFSQATQRVIRSRLRSWPRHIRTRWCSLVATSNWLPRKPSKPTSEAALIQPQISLIITSSEISTYSRGRKSSAQRVAASLHFNNFRCTPSA